MLRLSSAVAMAAACASLLGARAARCASSGEPVDLEWAAPSGCPSKDDEVRAIAASLGSVALEPGVTARVTIVREGPSYAAHVVVEGPRGRGARDLRARDCAEAADAAALIVALAVSPQPSPAIAPPAPPPAASAFPPASVTSNEAPAPPVPPAPQPPTPAAPPRPSVAAESKAPEAFGEATAGSAKPPARVVSLALLTGLEGGLLPALRAGLAVAGDLRAGSLFVEARVGGWAPASTDVAPGAGARFAGGSALVRGCPTFLAAPIELAPCAGVELDVLEGAATGSFGGSATAAWVGLFAGAHATLWIGPRVGLRLDPEIAFPLARPDFVLVGVGVAHRPSSAFGRLVFGGEVALF